MTIKVIQGPPHRLFLIDSNGVEFEVQDVISLAVEGDLQTSARLKIEIAIDEISEVISASPLAIRSKPRGNRHRLA